MSADPTISADTIPNAVPTPVAGAGSADLLTASEDPAELRALLERARERLSFYESFDRMIAEQMRRAGEMMAETVALREQAAQAAAQAARDREAIDEAIRQERERHRAVLEETLAEVRSTRPVFDAMLARLESAIEALPETRGEAEEAPAEVPIPEPETPVEEAEPEAAEAAPAEPDEVPAPEEDLPQAKPETQPADAPVGPSAIEVVAHGVPSATIAIALQGMLRGMETVTRVDAREFADGELRLHVECSGPIAEEALTGWLDRNGGALVSRNDKVIELAFS